MNHRLEIENLAAAKLEEAECLLAQGLFEGAFYLAGYAIELLLKAMICKNLGIPDFFAFDKLKNREAYKPFKSHDCEQLLVLSGLYAELSAASKADKTIKNHWEKILTWDESARYVLRRDGKEVEKFVSSVKMISIWISKHL